MKISFNESRFSLVFEYLVRGNYGGTVSHPLLGEKPKLNVKTGIATHSSYGETDARLQYQKLSYPFGKSVRGLKKYVKSARTYKYYRPEIEGSFWV